MGEDEMQLGFAGTCLRNTWLRERAEDELRKMVKDDDDPWQMAAAAELERRKEV